MDSNLNHLKDLNILRRLVNRVVLLNPVEVVDKTKKLRKRKRVSDES